MKNITLPRYPLATPFHKWTQKDFVLSVFSPTDTFYKSDENTFDRAYRSVKTCVDAGFTMLETGWATEEHLRAVLPACEEYGIDMIYQNLNICGGMQGRFKKGIDKSVIEQMTEITKGYKHCIGYYVWDEPYLPEQLEEARRQMDFYRELAPEKLLFTVAIPSYNDTYTWKNGKFEEYLRTFIEKMIPPVLSLDYYPIGLKENGVEVTEETTLMWRDLALMRKLSREYEMPMWFYYQGQDVWESGKLTFSQVRMFMNAGVLYGAKGLQHYTAVGAVVNEADGGKGIFFDEQKAMHEKFKALGNTLMALDCKRVIHDKTLSLADGLTDGIGSSELLDCDLPEKISVSEHEDAFGNKYLMVLNRDCTCEKHISLKLKRLSRLYAVSDIDGKQYLEYPSVSAFDTVIESGGMRLWRVQDPNAEEFTVEYKLKDTEE